MKKKKKYIDKRILKTLIVFTPLLLVSGWAYYWTQPIDFPPYSREITRFTDSKYYCFKISDTKAANIQVDVENGKISYEHPFLLSILHLPISIFDRSWFIKNESNIDGEPIDIFDLFDSENNGVCSANNGIFLSGYSPVDFKQNSTEFALPYAYQHICPPQSDIELKGKSEKGFIKLHFIIVATHRWLLLSFIIFSFIPIWWAIISLFKGIFLWILSEND